MSSTHVNGDIPSPAANSAFLQHLMSYPVIKDGVSTFKGNQLGQKSIQLSDSAYQTFAKPVLPYFTRPYEYVSPYVKKADSIGDQTLGKIDQHFPVVNKSTGELYADAKTIVFLPYRMSMEGKNHFAKTYSDQYKKSGEAGIVTSGKALVNTALVLSSETIMWVSDFINGKKAEVKSTVNN